MTPSSTIIAAAAAGPQASELSRATHENLTEALPQWSHRASLDQWHEDFACDFDEHE
jgi:hypothetical protein